MTLEKQEKKTDWSHVNSINTKSEYLNVEDPYGLKYQPFLINRIFCNFIDTIMQTNDMNLNPTLDHKLHYDYMFYSIRQKKRFFKGKKGIKSEDFELVQEYFGFSNKKTTEALRVLTEEQLAEIKERMFKGGKQ